MQRAAESWLAEPETRIVIGLQQIAKRDILTQTACLTSQDYEKRSSEVRNGGGTSEVRD
jgi:hypothetical protein